jgi:hypothetical protein
MIAVKVATVEIEMAKKVSFLKLSASRRRSFKSL